MTERFLLDTSVVSEFGPSRRPHPTAVRDWLAERYSEFHISTVTVAEIQQGISLLRRRDEPGDKERADALDRWLDDTILKFGVRVLSLDLAIAIRTGELSDYARSKGAHPGFADVAIAASAAVHDLTVLTRNLKHFTPLEIPCLDPFKVETG